MRGWKRIAGAVVLVASCASHAAASGSEADRRPAEQPIDLVICLDTSGSMTGLINSARQKLWQIVSELATAKPAPRLRVALLTYGTPSYGRDSGWVRVNLDLTDDLDRVYQELFALRTRGGTEYVARVVRCALDSLSWEGRKDTYRVIFVAGNESADQDRLYRNEDVCKLAATRDIIVNAIYCGGATSGDAEGYRRVARLADGRFASIDHNRATVTVKTPYDEELSKLSRELNGTYVAYGRRGAAGAKNQVAQDTNASKLSAAVAAQRAQAKASSVYRNKSWDLVDARKEKDFKLEEVPETELPEEMQKMTPDEREAHLDEMAKRRGDIQKKIADLSTKRRAHVQAEMAKSAPAAGRSFGRAVRQAVREQAEAKGFAF